MRIILFSLLLVLGLYSCRNKSTVEYFGPLPAPDTEFLEARDTMLEVGLRYLEKHFVPQEYVVVESYPDCEGCVCSWSQTFEKGISYTYNDCGIAGYEIEMSFDLPDLEVAHLRQLCESLFCCPSNFWNADSTRFEPADGDAGCYIEILSDTRPLRLKYFCSL
ncbi:MAG: hypothetical protein H6606_04430 [Flavobacteriales bacterium]|nr:hypothetical protein [Flavobacteriales bacterium]